MQTALSETEKHSHHLEWIKNLFLMAVCRLFGPLRWVCRLLHNTGIFHIEYLQETYFLSLSLIAANQPTLNQVILQAPFPLSLCPALKIITGIESRDPGLTAGDSPGKTLPQSVNFWNIYCVTVKVT